jgi:hypothetical protein
MKKSIFIIFSLCVNSLFAQNYQNICSPGVTFFNNSTGVLKAFRLDSIHLPGNSDTIFISYRAIRDTANDEYWGICSDTTNGSILGRKIYKKSDGTFFFFNRNNDTVRILSTAVLNQSWKFCKLPGNQYIEAKVTSIISDSVADTTDMIKVITLQAKDNLNNNISNILNEKTIKLSQHFGLAKMLDVFFIPDATTMYDLAGKSHPQMGAQDITWKEIYDFEVGDIFHYYHSYGMPPSAYGHTIQTVLGKVIKGNFDTVIYTLDNCSRTYAQGGPFNYHDTITETFDSADFSYSDFSFLPEQFSPLTLSTVQSRRSGDIGNYNQRMSKIIEPGFYDRMENESCWACTLFEIYEQHIYTKGLGLSSYIYNDGGDWDFEKNYLVYFKKGLETWGTPVSTDCNSLLDGENNLKKGNIHLVIAPNPVEAEAKITITGIDKNELGTLLLNDITGRELTRMKITSNSFTFDRTGLGSGLYLLSVTNQQGAVIAHDKIIMK